MVDPFGVRLVEQLRELEEVRAPNGILCGVAANRIVELETALREVREIARSALPERRDA